MSDGIQAYTGTQNGALYFNYWGGVVCLSNGNSIKADNGTFTATNYIGTKGTIANLMVTDTLRSFKWDIDHVANLGGTFLVTPTYIATANSATVAITVPSAGNPITATIKDNAISSGTLGGIAWNKDSKIKISGKLGGVAIGTCDGTLTADMNGSNHTLSLQFTYPGQTTFPLTSKTYSASEVSDLTVMLTTVGATNPIGIYMTARDSNNYSHISLYGGTSTTPTVRIGNLSNLDAVGGVDPDTLTDKWGIYTSNGFFKGVIAAERGIIGSNTTVTNNWQIGDRSIWYGNKIPGASTSALVISTGTASTNSIAGSGTSSKTWMLAAGTGFGVTNTGVLYATGATVTGTINANDGRFGPSNGYHISFDSSGMYVYQNASTKVASYGSNIVLGNNSSGHTNSYISMDYHNFQMINKENKPFVWFSDLRDSNGIAEIAETFIGDGSKDEFYLSESITSSSSVTVKQNDSIISSSEYTVYPARGSIVFHNAPANETIIEIIYSTSSYTAISFTLGYREENSYCGSCSVAQGLGVIANGMVSHAEGYGSIASGYASHAEGEAVAKGISSHAEGSSVSKGMYSHAEGEETTANGRASHAEGEETTANGRASHAEGYQTTASGKYQLVIGKNNIPDSNNKYAFIIGKGYDSSPANLSNALTVDWSGNVVASGNISASNFFPVNSIYVTSTNKNPNSILGFGTWTLFDKHYAPTMITNAFTLNSTNVSALSGAWVKIAEHNILIRIQFTNKVAYADSTIDVGTFNLAKIGLASGKMPWYVGSGYSDNGNAIVMPNTDGSGKIQIQDVVANGTATQIAAGSSIQVLFTITVHTIGDMLDSFCDKFFWKRTA